MKPLISARNSTLPARGGSPISLVVDPALQRLLPQGRDATASFVCEALQCWHIAPPKDLQESKGRPVLYVNPDQAYRCIDGGDTTCQRLPSTQHYDDGVISFDTQPGRFTHPVLVATARAAAVDAIKAAGAAQAFAQQIAAEDHSHANGTHSSNSDAQTARKLAKLAHEAARQAASAALVLAQSCYQPPFICSQNKGTASSPADMAARQQAAAAAQALGEAAWYRTLLLELLNDPAQLNHPGCPWPMFDPMTHPRTGSVAAQWTWLHKKHRLRARISRLLWHILHLKRGCFGPTGATRRELLQHVSANLHWLWQSWDEGQQEANELLQDLKQDLEREQEGVTGPESYAAATAKADGLRQLYLSYKVQALLSAPSMYKQLQEKAATMRWWEKQQGKAAVATWTAERCKAAEAAERQAAAAAAAAAAARVAQDSFTTDETSSSPPATNDSSPRSARAEGPLTFLPWPIRLSIRSQPSTPDSSPGSQLKSAAAHLLRGWTKSGRHSSPSPPTNSPRPSRPTPSPTGTGSSGHMTDSNSSTPECNASPDRPSLSAEQPRVWSGMPTAIAEQSSMASGSPADGSAAARIIRPPSTGRLVSRSPQSASRLGRPDRSVSASWLAAQQDMLAEQYPGPRRWGLPASQQATAGPNGVRSYSFCAVDATEQQSRMSGEAAMCNPLRAASFHFPHGRRESSVLARSQVAATSFSASAMRGSAVRQAPPNTPEPSAQVSATSQQVGSSHAPSSTCSANMAVTRPEPHSQLLDATKGADEQALHAAELGEAGRKADAAAQLQQLDFRASWLDIMERQNFSEDPEKLQEHEKQLAKHISNAQGHVDGWLEGVGGAPSSSSCASLERNMPSEVAEWGVFKEPPSFKG